MAPDRDVEKNRHSYKEGSLAHGSAWGMREPSYFYNNDNDNDAQAHRGRRGRGSNALSGWLNSFRRDPGRRITPKSVVHSAADHGRAAGVRPATHHGDDDDDDDDDDDADGGDYRGMPTRHPHGHYYDLHAANVGTANTSLVRELKGRHLQMIAIGGSIGTYTFLRQIQVLASDGLLTVVCSGQKAPACL